MDLNDAAITHIVWKDRLLEYLLKRDDSLDPAELSRDDRCPLGQWILGDARAYTNHSEYATLKAQHTRFHKAVGEVVRGARLGLSIKPETVLGTDSEFGEASAAVVRAIAGLQRNMREPSVGKPAAATATDRSNGEDHPLRKARPQRETVRWDPSYSVGVAQMDEHHQYLICLINLLMEEPASKDQRATTGIVLRELAEYAHNHFAAEERLMMETGYPHLNQHKREHERFTAQVAEMKKEFEANSGFPASKILAFLRIWLLRHIRQIDKKYTTHLNGAGIR